MNEIINEIIGAVVFLIVLFVIARLFWIKFQIKHDFRAESVTGNWKFNQPIEDKPKVKVIDVNTKK
jgi:hypothetical protein